MWFLASTVADLPVPFLQPPQRRRINKDLIGLPTNFQVSAVLFEIGGGRGGDGEQEGEEEEWEGKREGGGGEEGGGGGREGEYDVERGEEWGEGRWRGGRGGGRRGEY